MKTVAIKNRLTKRKQVPTSNEPKSMTGAEFARILLEADAILDPEDRLKIAAGIEEARRRMNNEHLH